MKDYFGSELRVGDSVFCYDGLTNPKIAKVQSFDLSIGRVLLAGSFSDSIRRLYKPRNVILESTLEEIYNYPRKHGTDFFGNEITQDSEILYPCHNLEIARITKVQNDFTEFTSSSTVTSRQNRYLFNISPLKELNPELFL